MTVTLVSPQIVPLTDAPSQTINVTLGGQPCRINVYTKSINVPIQPPGSTPSDPDPTYENQNPVFLDLYVNDVLIVGGALCLNESLIVMDPYLGFLGDLAVIDTVGNEDPLGTPIRLPPQSLRNDEQRSLSLDLAGRIPPPPDGTGNTIPGLGSRFQLTYWPNLK
jgi:hypothetical protein